MADPIIIPLASEGDLSRRNIAWPSTIDAGVLLASASAAVRDAAGTSISRRTSTITIGGRRSPWLTLPAGPVVAVDSVIIDAAPLTDWRLIDGRLWRARGWSSPSHPSTVTVTYTHGYDPVPEDIVNLVCMLTAAGVAAAEEGFAGHRGLSSVAVDDYREAYTTGSAEIIDPMELPQRTKDALRARFAGSADVIGVSR